MWKRSLLLAVSICLLAWQAVSAHAVLDRSQPAANAVLAHAPAEIRLWLTEPVEPKYSTIHLRDATGAAVAIPPSAVDANDPHQMFVAPGQLSDGLYTVVWVAVSAADGHRTEGSFPFTVGANAQPAATAAPAPTEQDLPIADMVIRWFNFLALVWGIGSIAFVVLVWRPAGPGAVPAAERRLGQVMWVGWLLIGVATVLILLLQAAAATGESAAMPSSIAAAGDVVMQTRFGALWLGRGVLWILIGLLLAQANRARWVLWAALLAGAALLALTSLFSHAGAGTDSTAAVVADWFHLLMTAIWLGGLVQLLAVLPVLAHTKSQSSAIARLIAQFSNVARVAVAGIIITGLYAAWLQVGSLDALFTTTYGQLLFVKLVLVVPLVGIAAFNLLMTQHKLNSGDAIWTQRLRWLVGAELGLALMILFAVAGMTALNPARNVEAQRQQAAAAAAAQSVPVPAPTPAMEMVDDLHVMFTVTPGWVGENEFVVDLSTLDGDRVTDASLIRMRFEHQGEDLGQSELRITPDQNPDQKQGSVYRIRGSNLSAPGTWKVRLTIVRPEQYDTVVDFTPTVTPRPLPTPAPVVEQQPPPQNTLVLVLTGIAALLSGAIFELAGGARQLRRFSLLAIALAALGVFFLLVAWLGK